MKLLFIFTGGTIGSTFDGEYISTDKSKPYKLIEAYKNRFGISFDYDITEPYTKLSENNTGETLSALCRCVNENAGKDYDGIIVTHGTDTLQYSAAALGYSLGNKSLPICIVSSNKPIEEQGANGLENLYGAVNFIKNHRKNGVWVIYKNPNDCIFIHRATRLIASEVYSDCFYSVCNSFYGKFDEKYNFIFNEKYQEKADEIQGFGNINLENECEEILRIEPYVGINYPELNDNIKYIIHGTFHSGTLNTTTSQGKSFFKSARNNGITVYLTGVLSKKSYSSTKEFDDYGLIPLPVSSPIAMYIKLWLCIKSNKNPNEFLFKSLGGDIL